MSFPFKLLLFLCKQRKYKKYRNHRIRTTSTEDLDSKINKGEDEFKMMEDDDSAAELKARSVEVPVEQDEIADNSIPIIGLYAYLNLNLKRPFSVLPTDLQISKAI